MVLQNRVTPFGEIIAVAERGLFFGNRGGCFHTERRELAPRRRWVSDRWICCLLEYKGWHREVMSPGQYTELFFLDEATALASGHRPCALCRRADHRAFREAWLAGNAGRGIAAGTSITAIDRILHAERTGERGPAGAEPLPTGAFVTLRGDARAWLVDGDSLLPWSPGGYGPPRTLAGAPLQSLLTPPSIAAALRAGYRPVLHPSAGQAAQPRPDLLER